MNKQNNKIFSLYYFLIVIIVVSNTLFILFPLINLLGYESSALNGILFALISGIYWLKYEPLKATESNSYKHHFKFYLYISLVAIIILTISTIFCQKCPISDGILFYLVLSMPSLLVGACLAQFAIIISRKFRVVLFVLLYFIVLFGFLPELYFNPQIYFFNPIFGYFPGVIYDHTIKITTELVIYRGITIIFSLAILIIYFFIKNFNKNQYLIVITIVIILYLSAYYVKPALGLATTLNKIEISLNGKIETENFIIYYPKSVSSVEKRKILLNHEYYYTEISNQFGAKLNEKITSIVFESGAQKKRLFGSQNADVAKPWLNQIYTNFDNYENSLKHELLHIFSKKYGKGVFNLPSNYNPALLEGFATAFENNFDDVDIDYLAFLAYNNNDRISITGLFSNLSFFSNVSSLSYIYAGSFIKYLSFKYSVEKVLEFYSNPDSKIIFGKHISTLEKDYYEYLVGLDFEFNKNKAQLYFGRVPLIKEFCARAAAKELTHARKLFSENEFIKAKDLFVNIYEYSKSYAALNGITQSYIKIENFEEALKLLESEKSLFSNSSYYYNIEYQLAFLNARVKNMNKTISYYDSLIVQNPHQNYFRSVILLKTLALRDSTKFYNFVENDSSRKEISKELIKLQDDSFLQYFIENYLITLTAQADSISKFDYSTEMSKINQLLEDYNYNSETYFLLSKLAFNNLHFEDAIKFCNIAHENVSPEKRAIVNSFLKKLTWMQNNLEILEKYGF